MNTKWLMIALGLMLGGLVACSQSNSTPSTKEPAVDKASLEQEIKVLENKLRQEKTAKLDKETASKLIEKSEAFAKAYPKDENSPNLLFHAADVARGIGKYGLAIKLWGNVYHDYPDYEKAPDSQFLIGFTYENNLNDKTQAKQYYNNFLTKHPDHHLVEQVKQTLSVIDKTPEELVKEFQRKNAGQRD